MEAESETGFRSYKLLRCAFRRKRMKKTGDGRKEECGCSFVFGLSLIPMGELRSMKSTKELVLL